jgi:hypothetical protein
MSENSKLEFRYDTLHPGNCYLYEGTGSLVYENAIV